KRGLTFDSREEDHGHCAGHVHIPGVAGLVDVFRWIVRSGGGRCGIGIHGDSLRERMKGERPKTLTRRSHFVLRRLIGTLGSAPFLASLPVLISLSLGASLSFESSDFRKSRQKG